ncbi:histidine kinase [Litchfieldella anticariensis FP35 = DSM 16096]|uniref:histidine kinase n=1 Tax=Litchfieldella anticariensis (strain DSM 16096 / CECT 5854 / CIP 108499 / LMG 22089 / FP35) TaxID=1121939 RepID=S2L5Q8_LITA3|nr:ATP-binding protein [Halomonas anticariensis]EPC00111.1 histidine kinase [Halomonas anticariensis FP35 = DSM 16096]
MSASLSGVFLLGASYLALLFACALAVERGWIPLRLVRHPAVYTLALGVYASAWAVYGSLELASQVGYGYLAYYLGVAGAFLLAPVLLLPIQRMTRTYQLSSLADLFAFRFRSRWVGTLVTLVSSLAVLPLLALQVQTMGDAIHLMTGSTSPGLLALAFCALIALFTTLFGARHTRLHARHDTLLATIALDSLIKLAAMLALGAIALFGIFDGPTDLQTWLGGPGLARQAAVAQLDPGQWRTLLLLFFAAAFLMPHMFHMTFAETLSRRALLQAGWSLPLFLLLMALPVPLILWGAQRLGADEAGLGSAYLVFGLSNAWWVDALAFIAGLAAATGTLIIISLALSGMILNHLVLVAHPPAHQPDLYRWLRWLRRALIAAVIFSGWLFYRTVGIHHDLATLGLASFVGMAQCLPGMLAVLYWPGANRKGMVAGLLVGVAIWLLGLWLPLLTGIPTLIFLPPGLEALQGEPVWYIVALEALAANILTFIVVSLATRTSEGERAAAEACSVDAVIRPKRLPLMASSGEDFKRHLSDALGEDVATREVDRALSALHMSPLDGRPYALRRLRDRIQANLSGLMGPSVAQDIVDRFLPYRHDGQAATDDIHFVESRLEAYRSRLTGLARELDGLRRYHRRTLTQLPVGLCAFGDDDELLMWNDALAELSGIDGASVIGSRRNSLPAPWAELLGRALANPNSHLYKQPVELSKGQRYLTLHKAILNEGEEERGGTVILVEDHSEMKWLEDELVHAARLASIGQLAAGVAHEIGNPITGISSLAQNLRYDTDDPALLETANQIQQLTDRVSRIVGSLVGFAHGGRHVHGTSFTDVTLHHVTEEALHLIHLARSGQDVVYRNLCPPDLLVKGDAQRLIQVLVNLLSNARDASPAGGEVVIAAEPEGLGASLTVTDEGQGIDARIRDHLFEPFTTTKAPGEGTGLGLPLVYSIIAEHHGQIHIESPPSGREHGTRIHLWLPTTREDDEDRDEPDSDR